MAKIADGKEIDERLAQILREADYVKSVLSKKLGIGLEYNYACMLQIDYLVDICLELPEDEKFKLQKNQKSMLPEMTARVFGSYFGECIRRTFSGKWDFLESGQAIVSSLGGTDIKVIPHNTLKARVLDKEELKVFATVQSVAQMLGSRYQETFYQQGESPKNTEEAGS